MKFHKRCQVSEFSTRLPDTLHLKPSYSDNMLSDKTQQGPNKPELTIIALHHLMIPALLRLSISAFESPI